MTPYEFRAEVERLLQRMPLAPVAIDLDDGRRVVVDTPQQVRATFEGIAVRPPSGSEVLVPAPAVQTVSRFDDLPAPAGGVSYRDFYATVRPLLRAEPFRPFEIELRDGRRVAVGHANQLGLAGRWASFLPHGAGFVRFTVDQVAAVRASAEAVPC